MSGTLGELTLLYSDVVKCDVLPSDRKDKKRGEEGQKTELESAFSEILPKSCPMDRAALERVSTPKSWVHLYQFEEEDDAISKTIILSLAEYDAKQKTSHVNEKQTPIISITSIRLTEGEIFEALLDAYVCLNEILPPNYSSPKMSKKSANPRIRNPFRIPFAWRIPKTPRGLWDYGPIHEVDTEYEIKECPKAPRYAVPVKLRGGGEHNVSIDPQSLNLEKHFFDKGSTSRVYKGTFTDLSGRCKTVCAKEFLVSLRGRYKSKVKKEVEKIVTLNHPNILIHYGIDFDRSILVTEYVEKIIQYDDSEERIHNTRQLLDIKEENVPWSLRIRIAVQAAEGLCYLHSQGIIHADIKAGNVFLSGGKDEDNWLVKLGDFGESLFEYSQFSATHASCLPQDSPNGNRTRRVTEAFLAPERADPNQKPTKASDIYAFSMFLVELTFPGRIHPFDGELPPNSDVVNCACKGARPTMPPNFIDLNSNVYRLWTDVVLKAWSQNPETRPDSQQLLTLLKELNKLADSTLLKSNKDKEIDNALAQSGVPDDLVSLECHQGTAAEVLSELVADSLNCTGNVSPEFQSTVDSALRSSDGTNACVFLSVLILDRLRSIVHDSNIDTSNIKTIAEDVIKTAPKVINPLRDVSKLMAVDEVLTLYKENRIIAREYKLEERVLGITSQTHLSNEKI